MTKLYRCVNNLGSSLDGFKTRTEANAFIKEHGKEDRVWYVESYEPDLIEKEL